MFCLSCVPAWGADNTDVYITLLSWTLDFVRQSFKPGLRQLVLTSDNCVVMRSYSFIHYLGYLVEFGELDDILFCPYVKLHGKSLADSTHGMCRWICLVTGSPCRCCSRPAAQCAILCACAGAHKQALHHQSYFSQEQAARILATRNDDDHVFIGNAEQCAHWGRLLQRRYKKGWKVNNYTYFHFNKVPHPPRECNCSSLLAPASMLTHTSPSLPALTASACASFSVQAWRGKVKVRQMVGDKNDTTISLLIKGAAELDTLTADMASPASRGLPPNGGFPPNTVASLDWHAAAVADRLPAPQVKENLLQQWLDDPNTIAQQAAPSDWTFRPPLARASQALPTRPFLAARKTLSIPRVSCCLLLSADVCRAAAAADAALPAVCGC
jgi:hypothetical protein